jgi:hypothetical protein
MSLISHDLKKHQISSLFIGLVKEVKGLRDIQISFKRIIQTPMITSSPKKILRFIIMGVFIITKNEPSFAETLKAEKQWHSHQSGYRRCRILLSSYDGCPVNSVIRQIAKKKF